MSFNARLKASTLLLVAAIGAGLAGCSKAPESVALPTFAEKTIDIEVGMGDMFQRRGNIAWVGNDHLIFKGVDHHDKTATDKAWLYGVEVSSGKINKLNLTNLPMTTNNYRPEVAPSITISSVLELFVKIASTGGDYACLEMGSGTGPKSAATKHMNQFYEAVPDAKELVRLIPLSSEKYFELCGSAINVAAHVGQDKAFAEWKDINKVLKGPTLQQLTDSFLKTGKLQPKDGYIYFGKSSDLLPNAGGEAKPILDAWRGAFFDRDKNDNVHWIPKGQPAVDLGFSIFPGGDSYAEYFPAQNAYVVIDYNFAYFGDAIERFRGPAFTYNHRSDTPEYEPYYVWTPGQPVVRHIIADRSWVSPLNTAILLTRAGHMLVAGMGEGAPAQGIAWIDPDGHVHLLKEGDVHGFGVSPDGCKLAVGMSHPAPWFSSEEYSAILHILDFCSKP